MTNLWSWYFALFGIHYLPFVIPASIVLVARLILRKVTRRELGMLGMILLLIALEAMQLYFDRCNLAPTNQDFFPTWERYFGVLAPLMWIWTAYGCVQIFRATSRTFVGGVLSCLALGGLLIGLFIGDNIMERYREYAYGAGRDAMVAGERIAKVIKHDYKGPRRYEQFPYTTREYFTSRRPVVVSFWGCAAWAAHTQSQGAAPGYPFDDDYLFARVDSRFKSGLGAALERMPDHQFVREVRGTVFKWRLYKRIKSTEGKGKQK